jgi:translation initiation factor IF-2
LQSLLAGDQLLSSQTYLQDRVQRQLLGEGLELEIFGGEIPCVEVSGVTGQGLDDLVETISATAEIMEIRAEQGERVHGHIIESKIQKGLG